MYFCVYWSYLVIGRLVGVFCGLGVDLDFVVWELCLLLVL